MKPSAEERGREHLEAILRAVRRAADPERAVAESVRWSPIPGPIGGGGVLAMGKAAGLMLRGFREGTGWAGQAWVVVPEGAPLGEAGDRVLVGDHPLPGERSVAAGWMVGEWVAMVRRLPVDEAAVVLISGGASSLVCRPALGSVEDVREVTELVMRAGGAIHDLNTVRREMDVFKGGGLARELVGNGSARRVVGLVLSDVPGDDLATIASGPLTESATGAGDAVEVLRRLGLEGRLARVVEGLQKLKPTRRVGVPDVPTRRVGVPTGVGVPEVRIVASNATAVAGAREEAARLGYADGGVRLCVEGEAREVGRELAAAVLSAREKTRVPVAVVWGGETTVTVRGGGRGGRNQEVALGAALELDGEPGVRVWVCSYGTDGVDGMSDAAGAMVSGETVGRARTAGLDAGAYLGENDSNGFFTQLRGCLIRTGPTGTNVNDVMVGLAV